MSPTPASKVFANGFMTGFLDVVSAMLSSAFPFEIESVQEVDDAALSDVLKPFTALIESPVKSGGGFALLMTGSMANYIVAGVLGEKIVEGDSIEVHDKATLSEVFSPCMGGGVSHFKEKYGKVIELQQAVVEPNSRIPFEDSTPSGRIGHNGHVCSARSRQGRTRCSAVFARP
ncbi:MAG: hypothetical protein WC655_26430 [Candidatus Hydrogenedentales bacterium]|jgi:hypothetical protein